MMGFDQLLQKDITGYAGPHHALIGLAPAFFRLLTGLLEDPALPGRLRPLVIAAIAYFTIPSDIMPEDLTGPAGYADDIYLSSLIIDEIRKDLESVEILERNWDGTQALFPTIKEILAREEELIGDRRELILWYIGYEYIRK